MVASALTGAAGNGKGAAAGLFKVGAVSMTSRQTGQVISLGGGDGTSKSWPQCSHDVRILSSRL
jgi:hypothetical protein